MDVLTRLRRVLPLGWFADVDEALDTILSGSAAVWDVLIGQLQQVRLQARLLTATGTWLDAKVVDYLGAGFTRRRDEDDAPFAARAAQEVLRPRATRPAIEKLLTDLGCPGFRVFEPSRPADTGGYDVGGVGYDCAGGYGSLTTPYQVFIDAQRPLGAGIPNNGGYDLGLGYDVGGGGYGSLAQSSGGVTDAQLQAAITRSLPAGVTAWVRLDGQRLVYFGDFASDDFSADFEGGAGTGFSAVIY